MLLFQHGRLADSQRMAADLADRFRTSNPEWAARFKILEAQAAAWRGLSQTVLHTLQTGFPTVSSPDIEIRRLALIGLADSHLHRIDDAKAELASAQALCSAELQPACTSALGAQGRLAMEEGDYDTAFRFYSRGVELARHSGQALEEATYLANIGVVRLFEERFDEAIDWLQASDRIAVSLDAADILLNNNGNLGWAYYKLGEPDRALALYQDAERRAVELGDIDDTISWLMTSGYVLQDSNKLPGATQAYREALRLSLEIHQREKVVDSLESLAQVSIQAGQLNEAERYIRQLQPLVADNSNHLDVLATNLSKAAVAAARRQDHQAEALFRSVISDPGSQTSMRLGAEHELARLYQARGQIDQAQSMYQIALQTFESARAQLKNENSKLPFLANATPIYDDYIHLLITQGETGKALAAADQSRARTLEQGLGVRAWDRPFHAASLRPQAVAAREHATLLFYWLGEKQSFLWAVTPEQTAVYSLPSKAEIARLVDHYQDTLLGPFDPLQDRNGAGFALYDMLIAPAQELLPHDDTVVVLCDGALSKLNFATLPVPGGHPHYWIEDANVVSAPSLLMLAAAKPSRSSQGRLLLVGDAVSPGPDYPALPNAATEMRQIRRHFAEQDETVLTGSHARSAEYFRSAPERFSYIDFVAHGVASRTDPLDSAIILSRTGGAEDSFKLYARDIIRHPLDARLVTISSCYGNGTRAYAGEGLVGLSWAFLRAGAHNVIGALWEVSDDSTPQLMDLLYQGLADGMTPSAALRRAQLALLHAHDGFSRPFYWGPFQLYTGL
jgi:CHAT domain-containing protein